ncbi:RsfA family transcriptional regulator [Pseudobacillus badius]|uniref:RsfA family transcriptional regulator n=1 Tax=Bacillus badius TaxID=1455 RepID=UPI0007B047AC|nr:RsfA family transcriptional regulator [Bacillus badius]KZN99897.1 transcriptional regulator [Bacillus badius]OCS86067.1 transcriptional regulator [Bacillus badius]OVE52470.1 RsfA family transcriptional regulator [Bacillus badius]TDW04220.1 prespore-specific regulator [Bacillus badius]UAT30589.1 RsfA family transcriptional regulator [Bacillus badius]
MKNRQDAWSEENDLLLAETVLRHVREGSTQLNAFEEVGDKLNRTSAACGFRWNAVVRHQYEKALALAKKQRKQRNRLLGKEQGGKKKLLYQPPVPSIEEVEAMSLPLPNDIEAETEQVPQMSLVSGHEDMSIEKVIAFLQTLSSSTYQSDRLKQENARLKQEIDQLTKEKASLEETVRELEQNSVTMQEDYETLIKIMNRARKLVLFDEEEPSPTAFKMDRNGNLEKLAE